MLRCYSNKGFTQPSAADKRWTMYFLISIVLVLTQIIRFTLTMKRRLFCQNLCRVTILWTWKNEKIIDLPKRQNDISHICVILLQCKPRPQWNCFIILLPISMQICFLKFGCPGALRNHVPRHFRPEKVSSLNLIFSRLSKIIANIIASDRSPATSGWVWLVKCGWLRAALLKPKLNFHTLVCFSCPYKHAC